MVAWQACIDREGLNVEHVEVGTTHTGYGFSPEVYKIIAQRLSNAADGSCALAPAKASLRRERRRRRQDG
jgi:hypothetical protein